MRLLLSRLLPALSLAVLLIAGTVDSSPQAAPALTGESVACTAMEVHISAEFKVTAVVFHQQDKNDGPLLASLLSKHSGAAVEFATPDGGWHHAQVFRLRTCFGRGLLVFSSSEVTVEEHRKLVIRFPAN